MTTTEEDLEQRRTRIANLQSQIADAETTRAVRQAEISRDVQAVQLDAEIARLEGQLATAKETAKVGSVKQGVSTPLAQAKEELRIAQEQAKATPAILVDTNAEDQPTGNAAGVAAPDQFSDELAEAASEEAAASMVAASEKAAAAAERQAEKNAASTSGSGDTAGADTTTGTTEGK